MNLVLKELKFNRRKIIDNLTKTIEAVVSMDLTGTDAIKTADIKKAAGELVNGIIYEEDYYAQLLDKMVVNDKDHVDVYLNMLPHKWSYTAVKSVKEAVKPSKKC